MSKYIGSPVVSLSTDTVDVTGDITTTDATPEVIIVNDTHEDTDGGREGKVTFKGQQSGGEETTLAQIQASHDGTSDDEKGDLIFKTNDGSDGASPTEAMRIDSDQQVGIGSTPTAPLDVRTSGASGKAAEFHNSSGFGIDIGNDSASVAYISSGYAQAFAFKTDPSSGQTERMRIDSSGHVLVGTTDDQPPTNNDASGIALRTDGKVAASRSSGISGDFNNGSQGDILFFRTAGTTLGTIGVKYSDNLMITAKATNAVGLEFTDSGLVPTTNVPANSDDTHDFGSTTQRWRDIYAGNATIQTSDETEKQQITALTNAEITAAKALSKLFKTFKWNSAVEAKGDNARTHTGVIAQQVETAMSDAGLDAGNYAFFISTTWWETQTEVAAVEADEENDILAQDAYTEIRTYKTQEEAPEGATERTRMGIRYPELLSFIGAATEQRLTSIEARLTALEGE